MTSTFAHVSFSQDATSYIMGTDQVFTIHNSSTLKPTFSFDLDKIPSSATPTKQEGWKSIGAVEMINGSDIIAFILNSNNVALWSRQKNSSIAELKGFKSPVLSVRLCRSRLIIVTQNRTYVLSLPSLKISTSFPTIDNEKGLVAVCGDKDIIATLSSNFEEIQILHPTSSDHQQKVIAKIDQIGVGAMTFSPDGSLLAISSKDGTLIQTFCTATGELQEEFRRGAQAAEIYSIAIHPENSWIAVSSSRGTIHIFKLSKGTKARDQNATSTSTTTTSTSTTTTTTTTTTPIPASPTPSYFSLITSYLPWSSSQPALEEFSGPGNPTSSFGFISWVLPKYFSSEWSFSQLRLTNGKSDSICCKNIVTFGKEENTILVITALGEIIKGTFDPQTPGQSCTCENDLKSDQ